MRSRDVWAGGGGQGRHPRSSIGASLMVARRPEARAVLEAFLATEMGEGCELLEPRGCARALPDAGASGDRRRACGARTSCGSRCARRDPGARPLARGGAGRHLPSSDGRARRSCRRGSRPAGAPSRPRLPWSVPATISFALRRSARALRPDPLQAAHAAYGAAAGRLAAAGAGDVGPGARALSGLRRPAGGGGLTWAPRGRAGRVAGQRRSPDRRSVGRRLARRRRLRITTTRRPIRSRPRPWTG